MAYSDFTLRGVKQAFSLKTEEQNDLFTKVVDAGVNENLNPWLQGQFPWGWQLALRKRVRK